MASPLLLPFWRAAVMAGASSSSSSSSSAAASAKNCRRCIQAMQLSSNFRSSSTGISRRRYASSSTSSSSSSSSSSPSTSTATSTTSSKFQEPPAASASATSTDSVFQPSTPEIKGPRLRHRHELYSVSSSVKRVYLYNEATAKKLVDKMDLGKTPDLVVVDLYAGKGLLSKEALKLKNVSQVIGIEDHRTFTTELHDLIEDSVGRFAQIALDPYWWDSYRVLQEKGLLDGVQKKKWEDDTTNLALMGVIPANINGDRLVIQQISCIASKSWLYTYGRFNSYFLIPRPHAMRILAPPGDKERRKLAVILQSLAKIELLLDTPGNLSPIKDHFKPVRTKLANIDYVLLKITPKRDNMEIKSLEDLEILEFLTKNMFVHRSAKWVDSIKYLAPGAAILRDIIQKSGYELDPKKRASDFTNSDWLALIQAFKDWPFRPEHLDQDDAKNSLEWEED
ncbi:S-adenosyl-L-methionine-dependent methyltransferase [Cystobasidium minutum MCA 4210]|uniref:S-adenosyl-L-methionine-dependent methyltransferase n=1 Tax=Cystobasidium minutum MCA 4210 TaxID=1397322 RepID=UPI0034CEB529|eukprot:jgi/Rhomi1/193731/gm1.1945_g